jgi:tetratricopeptide (TPR) repeat protein
LPDVWNGLAQVALGEDQVEKALSLAVQAKQLAAEKGFRLYQAGALRTEGRVHATLADYAAAHDRLAQSLTILDELGDAYEAARTKVQWAMVMEADGRAAEALQVCTEAFQVFEQLGAVADQQRVQPIFQVLGAKKDLEQVTLLEKELKKVAKNKNHDLESLPKKRKMAVITSDLPVAVSE